MKLIVGLILFAITQVLATKLVSVPFTAVDRKTISATSRKQGTLVNAPLENIDLAYLIDIEIGTPPQNFTLLLDTGSSTTWIPIVGCNFFCGYPKHTFTPFKSSTFNASKTPFDIKYGEGFSKGFYVQDTMVVNGVSVPNVNFALSNVNDGELTEDGADGILAIGPDRLSAYNNPNREIVPTVVSTMFKNNIIDDDVFSIYFQPVNHTGAVPHTKRINGEIVFGGIESKHYIGNVTYIPITSNKKFSDYWAVDIDIITVGDQAYNYSNRKLAAMVDTGSTLVFLPREIVNRVFRNVRGLRRDASGQFLVPCNAQNLPDIVITMNNYDFRLLPDDYVIRSGPLVFSNRLCYTYLQESPDFVDAILGYGFLQQYVSVYDNAQSRIGLATRATL